MVAEGRGRAGAPPGPIPRVSLFLAGFLWLRSVARLNVRPSSE